MTDYTKLIKDLLAIHKGYADEGPSVFTEAAEAIEAQAKEIQTLTAERDRLQAKLTALEKQEPVAFLAKGARFKTSEFPYGVCINGLPKELAGRWVALVAAEDDCHLKLAGAKAQEPEAWLPIETAPKDGTKFLAYGKFYAPRGWSNWKPELDEEHPKAYGYDLIQAWFAGGLWQCEKSCGFAPTHWVPLPEAPKGTGGQQ